MGFIREEVVHPTFTKAKIVVDEHHEDEEREEFEILSFEVDNFGYGIPTSPDDLIELGEWLVEQGSRIKKEYTSTGKPIMKGGEAK